MLKRYGKKTLEVGEFDRNWYDTVEKDVSEMYMDTKRSLKDGDSSKSSENFGNANIGEQEVKADISTTRVNSTHSPEENVFTVMIKRGGEFLVKAIT